MGRKNKQTGEQNQTGCMAFFVSVGRTVNQRLAVARNALRRKFRRDNKLHPLEPEELENETGTPDLVFALKPIGPVKAEQLRETSPQKEVASDKADVCTDHVVHVEQGTDDDQILQEQVRLYISGIIKNAVNIVKAEEEQKESESLTSSIISVIADEAVSLSLSKLAILGNTESATTSVTSIQNKMISEKSGTSIGSSDICQIAELAVGESLSKIVDSGNTNSSARRPRTVHEMLEFYGIPSTTSTDGMPPVDI